MSILFNLRLIFPFEVINSLPLSLSRAHTFIYFSTLRYAYVWQYYLRKGRTGRRERPEGVFVVPCEMGWHPIVYTLFSTPAFPRARCAPSVRFTGALNSAPLRDTMPARAWGKIEGRGDRSPRKGNKTHVRVFLSALESPVHSALSLNCFATVAKNANANWSLGDFPFPASKILRSLCPAIR